MNDGDPQAAGAPPEPIDEKLARVSFQRAPEPHIVLDDSICRRCCIERICVSTCPADNYRHDEQMGAMIVSTESCMECGSCRIVCTENAVSWRWPPGGYGVCYLSG